MLGSEAKREGVVKNEVWRRWMDEERGGGNRRKMKSGEKRRVEVSTREQNKTN